MTHAQYERPTPRRVMEILKEAGEEGIVGPDIARRFTIPDPNYTLSRKTLSVKSASPCSAG